MIKTCASAIATIKISNIAACIPSCPIRIERLIMIIIIVIKSINKCLLKNTYQNVLNAIEDVIFAIH